LAPEFLALLAIGLACRDDAPFVAAFFGECDEDFDAFDDPDRIDADFAIFVPVIDSFNRRAVKNPGRAFERYPVLADVRRVLALSRV
jgi:hypothetical protein